MQAVTRNPVIEEDLLRISQQAISWERLSGKTVLVTGANGLLSSYLIESLLYLNEHGLCKNPVNVVALGRNVERMGEKFKHHCGNPHFQPLIQDVSDPLPLSVTVDYIIHAASQASPKYYSKDPVGTIAPNIFGTHNLLSAAQRNKIEMFLFISSSEVYGASEPDKMPLAETSGGYLDPTDLRSCYAESKRMGETLAIAWGHQYGVPVTIARPFHTYGPGLRCDDGRVFADFISDVVAGRDISLTSSGLSTRAFCYVADTTAGLLTILLKGRMFEAYNVGNEEQESSVLDLAKRLVCLFPEKQLRVSHQQKYNSASDYLPSPVLRSVPNTQKLRELGWQPWTDIDSGFLRTVRSYQ